MPSVINDKIDIKRFPLVLKLLEDKKFSDIETSLTYSPQAQNFVLKVEWKDGNKEADSISNYVEGIDKQIK